MRTTVLSIFLPLALVVCAAPCVGQDAPKDFNQWLVERATSLLDTAKVQDARVQENGKGSSRQKETPSGDDRSTSLVDQSSTSDFFSTAIQFIPVSNISGLVPSQQSGSTASSSQQGSGSGSVTVTAYSLLAALSKQKLIDPTFYKLQTNARRISFTLGTTASDAATDGTTEAGTILGFKYVFINGRDLYSKTGQEAIRDVQNATTQIVPNDAQLSLAVKELIFDSCQPIGECKQGRQRIGEAQYPQALAEFWQKYGSNINQLTFPPELLHQIDARIQKVLPSYETYDDQLRKAYDKVRNGRQFAVSYQVVKRPDNGNDDHRAEIAFDNGLTNRITWTWNASFDYKNRKQALDSRGGRIATEFIGNLSPESSDPLGRAPVTLSFSGEAKWMEMLKPQYTFQAKLSIPLATGLEFPIVYRYANRRDQINQSDSEARLGLTVDVERLIQALR
jgi:hypothetical protein